MADFYAALRRQNGAAPLADFATALNTFVLWTLLFLGPMLELSGGMLVSRADRRNAPMLILFLPVFFVSIALCTKAWFDGVLGRRYAWVKTDRSLDTLRARS